MAHNILNMIYAITCPDEWRVGVYFIYVSRNTSSSGLLILPGADSDGFNI
jgi:hypothetical protein